MMLSPTCPLACPYNSVIWELGRTPKNTSDAPKPRMICSDVPKSTSAPPAAGLRRLIPHDDGAAFKTGPNGGVDGSKANSEVRLLVELFKIFNNAVATLAGAAPPEGVESVNSVPQLDPSPALPPLLFTHAETMPASELISVLGTASPAGTEVPGDVPVAVLAYCEASVNAAVSAGASDVPDPMLVGEVIYGKSAATAATVVTSFRLMKIGRAHV